MEISGPVTSTLPSPLMVTLPVPWMVIVPCPISTTGLSMDAFDAPIASKFGVPLTFTPGPPFPMISTPAPCPFNFTAAEAVPLISPP